MKTLTKLTATIFLSGLTLGASLCARAQTANWIGPASGGEWNTPANWDIGVPNLGTNAVIGNGSNVSYSLPMSAGGFGTLSLNGILTVSANGFSSSAITLLRAGGGNKLFVTNGGTVTVSGNLAFTSNSVVTISTGAVVTVQGSLFVGAGSTGGTATGTAGCIGIMTNNGATLNATVTTINPASASASSLFVINGGVNNLGTTTIKRSSPSSQPALGTEGLIINNGLVTTTNLNVGGNANSYTTMLVAGGNVTNIGNVLIQESTSGRNARLLQTGGLFVIPDPGIVNPDPPASGDISIFSVTGGTNILGGFSFGAAGGIAGTVNFTNSSAIFVGSQGIVGNGAVTLNAMLNNGGMFGATTSWVDSAAMTLNGGTFTFQAADPTGIAYDISLSAALGGTGALNKTGAGTLTLNAANTYSGSTLINGGTLAVGASGSLASPLIIVGPAGIFDVSALGGAYSPNSGQTLSGSGSVTGLVSAANGIINPGSNALTGTLTFASGLTEQGGVVNHFDLSSNPSGPSNDFVNVIGDLTLNGTNTILVSGSLPNGTTYTLIQYSGNFNGTIGNFALTGATGVLTNNATAKTIALMVLATTRGPTNVVWLGNAVNNDWDSSISTNWLNGSSLDFFISGDTALFNDIGANNPVVTLVGSDAPASVTVNSVSNYTFTGSGSIDGIGGITKTNSGSLTVLTTNNYSGPTILNGGVLAASTIANSGLPSSIGAASADPNNLVFNGGVLNYIGASASTDHGITLTNAGGTLVVTNGTTLTLNGSLIGNGALTLIDSGTLNLAAGNSYSGGTTIGNGTLTLNNASAAGTGPITFAGGTLTLGAGGQPTYANAVDVPTTGTLVSAGGNNNVMGGAWSSPVSAVLNVSVGGTGTFTVNGSMSNYLGTIELGGSTGFFRFNSGGGNSTLGALDATIDVGTNTAVLEARNPGTLSIGALEGGSGTFVKGPSSTAGTLVFAIGSNTNNPSTTYYGTIENNAANEIMAITKVGSGTLSLAGQNTYTGSTVISNGVLALVPGPNGDGSINDSATITIVSGTVLDVSARSDATLQLQSGQTLTGRGTILGSLNAGGTVAPGGGVGGNTGVLTVTNSVALNGTAWMKLNRTNSLTSDRLVSSQSTITYGGGLVVTNIGAPLQPGDTFTLFSGGSLGAGTFSSTNLPNYYAWDTSNLGVNGSIQLVSILPGPNFNSAAMSGSNLLLTATNGAPNGPVVVLSSTEVNLPLNTWTPVQTNAFDSTGSFNFSTPIDPNAPRQFFVLQAH